MKDECCGKCRYFAQLQHNFKKGKGFETSNCCVMFPLVYHEGYVIETTENDMCEMFYRRKDNEG